MTSLLRAKTAIFCEHCSKKVIYYAYSEKDQQVCCACFKKTYAYAEAKALEDYAEYQAYLEYETSFQEEPEDYSESDS